MMTNFCLLKLEVLIVHGVFFRVLHFRWPGVSCVTINASSFLLHMHAIHVEYVEYCYPI